VRRLVGQALHPGGCARLPDHQPDIAQETIGPRETIPVLRPKDPPAIHYEEGGIETIATLAAGYDSASTSITCE
jgi:hypothetical protein